MNDRPTAGSVSSLLVNLVLFPAVLIGLTMPQNTRAESPSVTLSAAEYFARAETKAGREYERIRVAAAIACESSRAGAGGPLTDAYRACIERSIASRVADVNDRALWAYHRHRLDGLAADLPMTLVARSR